mgnify:CR=1 FL=1
MNNGYTLVDKSRWKRAVKKIQVAHSDIDQVPIQVAHSDSKDTHIFKDTHIQHEPNGSENIKTTENVDKSALIRAFECTSEWQFEASRIWQSLGLEGNPSPSWLKLFREAFGHGRKGLLMSTYTAMADLGANDPEKYFYKVYFDKTQNRKEVSINETTRRFTN